MNNLIERQEAIDALEERLRANGYSNVALVSELNRSIGYLMRLPTVDAIPVEWIAEWRWKNSDVCCDKRVSDLFGKMIEDWRKENGQSDS